MTTVITKSGEETQKLGEKFAQQLKSGGVVCLYGDLGAGKTTFVQGLVRGLGSSAWVSSPTFVLVRRYDTKGDHSIYHVDLYRLENLLDAKAVGIGEMMSEQGSVVLIEWPEKIASLLPRQRWEVRLTARGENEREITLRQLV